MPALQPAQLTLSSEGIPWSETYGDIYHSSAGAFAQAHHVFLAGNKLPERWQHQQIFVIVETGFGLGNNFLATWQKWKEDPLACQRLHFISVEKHPFSSADLHTAHQLSQAPQDLSDQLVHKWPLPLPGCHRIEFEDGRITLSLFFGDIEILQKISASADAIFLDGFSPRKNPEMWSEKVCQDLARLSQKNTTLATWCVSGPVRGHLKQAGFNVEKTSGFSQKREMLQGVYSGTATNVRSQSGERRVLIIGAGLAGTSAAERLVAHGFTVELLEAQAEAAQGASGNLAGAFRPLPSLDDNKMSRITRNGFFYGLRHLETLADKGHSVLWDPCGVLHLARGTEQELRQQQVVEALKAPPEYLEWVNAAQATKLAGHTVPFGGWWFPQGGWIQPSSLCTANLDFGGGHIHLHTGVTVSRIQYEQGQWKALDETGTEITAAPQVVLANAYDARRLAQADWLPLQAIRGQVSHLPIAQLGPLGVVVCGQGYITPGIGGNAALGASFVTDDFDLTLRENEHAENLAKLGRMLPDMVDNLSHTANLNGRVSLRPVSGDRMPIVGQLPAIYSAQGYSLQTLPRTTGLWLLTGFGARGLVWSSICAELLASQMSGAPLPIERDLADALDPARFVIRGTLNPPFP